MTPITGITEEDLRIATAIEKAVGRGFTLGSPKKIYGMIEALRVRDILRALGRYAAEDPEFRARYVQAAKDAGLIP